MINKIISFIIKLLFYSKNLFTFYFFFVYYYLCQVIYIFSIYMSQNFQIVSHWSTSNPLAEQSLDLAVQNNIDTVLLSKRYRRLVFYFFQKEITSDIYDKLSDNHLHISNIITDPEMQALVARSALGYISSDTIPFYASTLLINDYLLGQDDFIYEQQESDNIFAKKFIQLISKQKPSELFLKN